MPFCESCARYLTPTAMSRDGSCPSCGKSIASEKALGREEQSDFSSRHRNEKPNSAARVDVRRLAATEGDELAKAPWHFKLLITGLVLYLGWRIISLFL